MTLFYYFLSFNKSLISSNSFVSSLFFGASFFASSFVSRWVTLLINLISKKMQKDTIRKSMTLWINKPYWMFASFIVIDSPEKSIPPKIIPKIGDKILLKSELTKL